LTRQSHQAGQGQAPDAEVGSSTLLVETSRTLPLVSMAVALRSGTCAEPPEREGLCRLLARLMRRTGGGLDPQVLEARVDALGASFGVDVSHSAATFQATVLSRSFDRFVDLLVDVLARPSLSVDELERLKRETESELVDALDNDRLLAHRWFRRRVFGTHPYGRSVHGTIRTVRTTASADIADLYGNALVRNNLVFAIAGDVDGRTAECAALRIAHALPCADAPPDDTPEPRIVPGRRLVVVDKPERTQCQILLGGLGTHARDPDHIALHVANTILGGTFTARLSKAIRSERGWSYGAYSSLPFDRRRQAFSMWTFPKAEDAVACVRLELDMLEDWVSNGVTDEELAWAKLYLVRSHAFAIDTATKRISLALDEVLYDLPARYHAEYPRAVLGVTRDEATAAIAKRISADNLLVAVVGTESEVGAALRDAIPGLVDYEVVPFDEDG
jgi:zinc protease